MSEIPANSPAPLPSKARILAASLIDFLVDLLLPLAIYALLARTGLSAVICLSIGGYFVAAKAFAGRIAAPDSTTGHPGAVRALAGGAFLAAACTVVTIATTLAGGSDGVAIGLGSAILILVQGVDLARRRRTLDGFALLVLIELIATILLTYVSNDPRFVLIRPSFYTAIAGVYVLATTWSARPFMMQVTRAMAADGDPVRAAAFDRAGRESPRFRRAEQAMTAGLGIVLLAEALLRVVVVLSLPPGEVLAASVRSQLPGIGLFVLYLAVARLVFVPRASREVDALMPAGKAA